MRIALCNEVLQPWDFARQCDYAARLGYDGLELAPFTLDEAPHLLSAERRRALRRAAADAGVAVTGLHWLLVTPKGLSITTADAAVRRRTVEVMTALVGLCADLGGAVLVHGSPAQRRIEAGEDPATARERAIDALAAAARAAERAGVVYCLEPLSADQTNFVNTVAEASAIVDAIGSKAFRTMLDTSSAALAEREPLPVVLERGLVSGHIAHVQFNDRNRRGPGEGDDRFAPILEVLLKRAYGGTVAIEPFKYEPDGPACAARAIGYTRGLIEALALTGRGARAEDK
jgi:sugar phosphate isomerase/epimerase